MVTQSVLFIFRSGIFALILLSPFAHLESRLPSGCLLLGNKLAEALNNQAVLLMILLARHLGRAQLGFVSGGWGVTGALQSVPRAPAAYLTLPLRGHCTLHVAGAPHCMTGPG